MLAAGGGVDEGMGIEAGGFWPQLARVSDSQNSTGGETNFMGEGCGSALKFSTICSAPARYTESAGSPFPALSRRPPTPSWGRRGAAINFQPAPGHESRDGRRRLRTGVLLTRSTFQSPCVAKQRALRRNVEFRRACWRAGVQGALRAVPSRWSFECIPVKGGRQGYSGQSLNAVEPIGDRSSSNWSKGSSNACSATEMGCGLAALGAASPFGDVWGWESFRSAGAASYSAGTAKSATGSALSGSRTLSPRMIFIDGLGNHLLCQQARTVGRVCN